MFSRLFLLALSATLLFAGCKKEYDEPPVEEYPSLTANTTIADLVIRHTVGLPADSINTDIIIEGIVVADDRSGNFYKNIVIQDATGGVQIRVDATSYYTKYPIGRKVWVKCNGLFIGDYSGVPQISFDPAGSAIPESLVSEYVVGGERNQTITPNVRRIENLTRADLNTLVRIDSVQFATADANQYYSDPIGRVTTNRTILACNGGRALLRTSGYAEFAAQRTPQGSGSITVVVGEFNGEKQLFIRELTDLSMTGERCNVGAGGPPITIGDLRALYTGSAVMPPSRTLRGMVISDRLGNNWDSRTLVIQDATAGITLRLTDPHSLNVGDEVEIAIGDDSIKTFNGLLQLYTATGNIQLVSLGNTPTAQVVTIADYLANQSTYESMLLEIQNATLSGGATFSGSRTVTDATGNTIYYTRSAATFASTSLPTGNVTVKAVAGNFNGAQLLPRNANDVTGGTVVVPTLEAIADVRALHTGSNVTIGNVKIRGIVISDRAGANWDTRNVVIQEAGVGGAGILVRFDAAHSLDMGDDVEINVSGGTITLFSGLMQIQGVATTAVTDMGTGSITPRTATISQIQSNFDAWESTLVLVADATLSGGTTYSGSRTITDASASTTLFTRTAATFAGATMPTGTVQVTAIVGDFNGLQLQLRNTNDVQ